MLECQRLFFWKLILPASGSASTAIVLASEWQRIECAISDGNMSLLRQDLALRPGALGGTICSLPVFVSATKVSYKGP